MKQLPEVIFRLIQTFLSSYDYHYLVNSSKRLFGDLKRRTIYFQLSEKWSRQYVEDKDFKRMVGIKSTFI